MVFCLKNTILTNYKVILVLILGNVIFSQIGCLFGNRKKTNLFY